MPAFGILETEWKLMFLVFKKVSFLFELSEEVVALVAKRWAPFYSLCFFSPGVLFKLLLLSLDG